jgi:hypothetical protein
MNELNIEIAEGRNGFEPGEELAGRVRWSLDAPPRSVDLRLFWFTRGKGTEDIGVAQTVHFDQAKTEETRTFRLRLPEAPYSVSGKLISVIWALELVAQPSKTVVRREIVVAPGGEEVRLNSLPARAGKKRRFGFGAG